MLIPQVTDEEIIHLLTLASEYITEYGDAWDWIVVQQIEDRFERGGVETGTKIPPTPAFRTLTRPRLNERDRDDIQFALRIAEDYIQARGVQNDIDIVQGVRERLKEMK